MLRDAQVGHARLHARAAGGHVHFDHRIEARHGQEDAVGERQPEDLRERHPLHDEEREDRVDERVHRLQALTGH